MKPAIFLTGTEPGAAVDPHFGRARCFRIVDTGTGERSLWDNAAAAEAAVEWTISDAPPGTACPMIETVRGCESVPLVTEPTPFGVHDLRSALEVTDELGLRRGVVINRSGHGAGETRELCLRPAGGGRGAGPAAPRGKGTRVIECQANRACMPGLPGGWNCATGAVVAHCPGATLARMQSGQVGVAAIRGGRPATYPQTNTTR